MVVCDKCHRSMSKEKHSRHYRLCNPSKAELENYRATASMGKEAKTEAKKRRG